MDRAGFKSTELFRKNVRQTMEQRKISLTELAKKAGLSVAQASNILNRRGSINIASAERIADALGVSVSTLFSAMNLAPSKEELDKAYRLVRRDLMVNLIALDFGYPPDPIALFQAFVTFLRDYPENQKDKPKK